MRLLQRTGNYCCSLCLAAERTKHSSSRMEMAPLAYNTRKTDRTIIKSIPGLTKDLTYVDSKDFYTRKVLEQLVHYSHRAFARQTSDEYIPLSMLGIYPPSITLTRDYEIIPTSKSADCSVEEEQIKEPQQENEEEDLEPWLIIERDPVSGKWVQFTLQLNPYKLRLEEDNSLNSLKKTYRAYRRRASSFL